jgi:N-sulfoglucosamine sulfohydrolase
MSPFYPSMTPYSLSLFRGILFKLALGVLFVLCWEGGAADRPNILFAISDDQSWMHVGAYGDRGIKTPAFDRIAKEGVRFDYAFSAAPSCAPSRAAILTGRHIWQIEEGGILFGILKPAVFPVFTNQLKGAGYQLAATGKTYGPGRIEDATHKEVFGEAFNGIKLKERTPGLNRVDYAANFSRFLETRDRTEPFFFWYGATEPHQSYDVGGWKRAGKRLEDARLPECLPDDPVTRGEILDYGLEVEHFDRHLGRMLSALEKAGELENTLIVVTSDHGNPLPRSKCNLYDSGTRVPFAVRLPERVPGGRVISDFINLVDVGPTLLEFAGVSIPASVSGRSLMPLLCSNQQGRVDPTRSAVVTGFERHIICRRDGVGYPMRSLRTHAWSYIRNYEPDRWPAGDPDFNSSHQGFYGDVDSGASKDYMLANAMNPKVRPFFLRAFGRRPAEELFDMEADPGQLKNLATLPEYQSILSQLREQLDSFLEKQHDPRRLGIEAWDTYPFSDQSIFKNSNWRTEGFGSPLP